MKNSPRAGLVLLLILGLGSSPQASADPPKANYLFPGGAQRGQTITTTANGTFGQWPVSVWVDRPGITATCAETKGTLKVTVDPQAGSGVYWLRLYDPTGAAELRPFIVDSPTDALEKEPNDAAAQATPATSCVAAFGQLAKRGDVDTFSIRLKQGETLVASVWAHRLGSPMDAVMQVASSQGFVLAQQDDECGLDPQLTFTVPRDDTYLVRLFAFPETPDSSIGFAGGDNFVYRLTLTTGPFLEGALPLSVRPSGNTDVQLFGWNLPLGMSATLPEGSPQDDVRWLFHPQAAGWLPLAVSEYPSVGETGDASAQQPQRLESLPIVISGRLERPGDEDVYSFSGTKGQKVQFRVASRSLGYPTDSKIQLADEQGKVLAEADDAGQQPDAVLAHALPADGPYRLSIKDVFGHGGQRYFYRLTAAPTAPEFTLKLASNTFSVAPGKPLEIPVTIERLEGFSEDISIRAAGLPDGITAEAVTSAGKGDTAKTVKLVLTASQGPVSASFRVAGTALVGDKPLTRLAQFTAKSPAADHRDHWLTVLAGP